jgi:hypothetical protein
VIINGIMKKQELFFPYLKTLGGRNLWSNMHQSCE